jgi:hypothetical protein
LLEVTGVTVEGIEKCPAHWARVFHLRAEREGVDDEKVLARKEQLRESNRVRSRGVVETPVSLFEDVVLWDHSPERELSSCCGHCLDASTKLLLLPKQLVAGAPVSRRLTRNVSHPHDVLLLRATMQPLEPSDAATGLGGTHGARPGCHQGQAARAGGVTSADRGVGCSSGATGRCGEETDKSAMKAHRLSRATPGEARLNERFG